YSGLSQSAIAQRLGISQMHVSRLQRNALGKLKLSLFKDPAA
ncbi:MAG: RNA polymerase sigma factor SigB, partial [Chloroflexi bacterium]|nr:RNA polymerase sigma factor SigB [Chloroflexota bacterium]